MMFKKVAIAAATVAAGMGALLGAPAAQAQEQFQPLLVVGLLRDGLAQEQLMRARQDKLHIHLALINDFLQIA